MRKSLIVLGALTLACGDRPDEWSTTFQWQASTSVGLTRSVAMLDSSLNQVMLLSSPEPFDLQADFVPVGKRAVTVKASPDRERLYVLSNGVQPRRNLSDELPRLTIIEQSPTPRVVKTYELEDPLAGLELDPEGEWAVIYDANGVVQNPNELILIDLLHPDEPPIKKTIRSFGSSPQRFTFTSELSVPRGPRRLLAVQTEQDVALIDLAEVHDPSVTEITVQLPRTASNAPGEPAQIAFHDGDPERDDDAELAVRLANDSSVLLLRLGVSATGRAFGIESNSVELGGVPSTIDFVRTDSGVRLAALVPTQQTAVLVDLETTNVTPIDLPHPFNGMARVTDSVDAAPDASDVALLYGNASRSVSFWALGKTSGTPYRSIDDVTIQVSVGRVLDVPGTDFAHYKILEAAAGGEFYVLDLNRRQSYPMLTDSRMFSLVPSPDGRRLWAFAPGGTDFASIGFSDLHPVSLSAERPISGVYDIGRGDTDERAAVVVHVADGNVSATVLDALAPDGARTRYYDALSLGGVSR
jgi:hypothetical protein